MLHSSKLFQPENCILVVIDVQGRLATLMHEKDILINNISKIIKSAQHLNIPILSTEQVPEKIGHTIDEIKSVLGQQEFISKSTFSCCGSDDFNNQIQKLNRKQVILCGIETHVCVIQTANDLMIDNYQIQILEDAVSSRVESDKRIAIQRMRDEGMTISSIEMLVTELLKGADHPKFREVVNLIR